MQILEMAKGNRNGRAQEHRFSHFPQKTEVPTFPFTPYQRLFCLSFFCVLLQRSLIVFSTIFFLCHTDAFNDQTTETSSIAANATNGHRNHENNTLLIE